MLKQAIVANQAGHQLIDPLVRDGTHFRHLCIDWRGSLRYPRSARINGREDPLSALMSPR